jgi:hypothetical protein
VRSHLIVRSAVAVAMLGSAAAGVLATAPSAAAIQQCTSYQLQEDYGVSSSPAQVYVDDIDFCEPGPGGNIFFPVTISKYVGGVGWEVVARGSGSADYTCTGGQFLYTTSVTTAENKPSFYCG